MDLVRFDEAGARPLISLAETFVEEIVALTKPAQDDGNPSP